VAACGKFRLAWLPGRADVLGLGVLGCGVHVGLQRSFVQQASNIWHAVRAGLCWPHGKLVRVPNTLVLGCGRYVQRVFACLLASCKVSMHAGVCTACR
jgi:hypothetical protein